MLFIIIPTNDWLYYPDDTMIDSCYNNNITGQWIFIFPFKNIGYMWTCAKHLCNNQMFGLELNGVKCLNYHLHNTLKEIPIMFFFVNSENEYYITKKEVT